MQAGRVHSGHMLADVGEEELENSPLIRNLVERHGPGGRYESRPRRPAVEGGYWSSALNLAQGETCALDILGLGSSRAAALSIWLRALSLTLNCR